MKILRASLYALALAVLLDAASARADGVTTTPDSPFQKMLAHVYEENPQLRGERDALRLLDERVSESAAGFRPMLAFNGELGEARVEDENQPWHYGQDRNLALTATQPLYNGALSGQWHAANKRVMEGRAHLSGAEQKILLAAITSWLSMVEAARLVELNRDNASLTQNYLEATQQRLAAGDGTRTDIAVAESRAADGETRYAIALSGTAAARAAYQRATGLPPQQSDLPNLPPDLPVSNEEAVALARQNNPDLTQADYEVAATNDEIDSATGARLPYIFMRGTLSDEHAQDLGLSRVRTDSITINASFPLYQGGAEYAKVREAKIAHEKSRFDALSATRNVTEEAEGAWSRFHAAQSVIEASNRASAAADRALAGIIEEQKHGTRTLTEALDAQAQALNARITALHAQTNLRLEAFRLLAAVGRLTAQGLNLPTAPYDPNAHYDDVASRWYGTSIDPQ